MSVEEADRAVVIRDVAEKRLRQREAAERLGIGVRQVKRLARRYREQGTAGLAWGHRGRRPNNAIDDIVRGEVLELVRERYPDFGPTFAREKLVEVHGHRLSVETLRGWMIADGLWRAKARGAVRVHQSRPRRECVGDLVQIDGSPHAWFEGRGPECTLIVFVDDATTRLLASRFSPEETTEAYMETTRAHLAAHGRPVAYYSDRYSVFRVNKKDKEDELTQFSRALRTLDIAAIHAGSPQAKAGSSRGASSGQPDAAGSSGEGDAAARHRRHGGGQRVPAGVHGGLQPALSGGAAEPGGRAPRSASRHGARIGTGRQE